MQILASNEGKHESEVAPADTQARSGSLERRTFHGGFTRDTSAALGPGVIAKQRKVYSKPITGGQVEQELKQAANEYSPDTRNSEVSEEARKRMRVARLR